MRRTIANETILDAALEIFAKEGYNGATTKKIAERAGINEVTLFRRFGNKQKLLQAVVEQQATKLGAKDIVYTGDLEADLVSIINFYLRLFSEQQKILMLLVSELARQPELMQMLYAAVQIAQRWATIIQTYQDEGKLIKEPPLQTLASLVGPVFLGHILGRAISDVADSMQNPEQIVKQFLDGRRLK